MSRSDDSATIAVLRRLSVRGAYVEMGNADRPVVISAGRPALRPEPAHVKDIQARGLIAFGENGKLVLTEVGKALVRRYASGVEDFAGQHQRRSISTVNDPTLGEIRVVVNDNESPLARMRARKGSDGQPMLSAVEFAAGERLRSDYTRSQFLPRVTSNWSVATAEPRAGAGRGVDLAEAAIAARRRIELALKAVGPEFAGVLVDVCCFLKGLEEVERERRWPARSAKVVLRFALAALARHYGLAGEARGPTTSPMRKWASADVLPGLD